jgi:hypothetical protein
MKPEEEFLKSDFEQCFEMMRHYDSHFFAVISMLLSVYTGIIASVIAFYNDLIVKIANSFLIILLALIWVSGLFALLFLLRNRVYFAGVTQYINEIRGAFLQKEPMNFRNEAGMPTSYKSHKVFNPVSTHSLIYYYIALLNSISFGYFFISILRFYRSAITDNNLIKMGTIFVVLCFITKILYICLYLRGKEDGMIEKKWLKNNRD